MKDSGVDRWRERRGKRGGTYAAGRGKGTINVEKADGVFQGAFCKRRVHACRFGHDGRLGVDDLSGGREKQGVG